MTKRLRSAVYPGRTLREGRERPPEFRTKLQIGAELAVDGQGGGFAFRAVAADSDQVDS